MVESVPNSAKTLTYKCGNFKKISRALETRNAWVFTSLRDKVLFEAQIMSPVIYNKNGSKIYGDTNRWVVYGITLF